MKKRSFTLLELLVSIGIILVLAAITFGGITYASARAQEAKTIATMEAFKQDYGYYPISTTASRVDLSQGAWNLFMNNGPQNKRNRAYIEGEPGPLIDAYGQAFWYQSPGSNNSAKFDLWSTGKDKSNGIRGGNSTETKPGAQGSDDICSWKQN